MRSYKNIAAAAAADLCMTPQRSPIVSAEPSTPPSRGRYSLRSSPHADVDVVEPKSATPTTTAVVGSAERSQDGGGSEGQLLRNEASRFDSSEEERDIARIAELEATRRGIAPAPEEVRPRPRAHPARNMYAYIYFSVVSETSFLVPLSRFVKKRKICIS